MENEGRKKNMKKVFFHPSSLRPFLSPFSTIPLDLTQCGMSRVGFQPEGLG
jgi:hypothetical protein